MIKVFTLNWNGTEKLVRLTPGLLKNLKATGEDYEWHIRDNGSQNIVEDSNKWSKLFGNNIFTHCYPHNRDSFAQGMNYLAKLNDLNNNDFILLLNNDVEFFDDTSLSKMLKIAKNDSKVGIVGARLLYNGTNKLQHAGVIFGKRYGLMPYHFRHQETSDKNTEKNREFQAVTAACSFVKASVWKEVEGLDQNFKWAFEDVDLSLKAKTAGYKVVYCGETKIYHEESASLKKNPVNKLFVNDNVRYFRSKWSGKYDLDHEKYLNNPNYMVYGK